MPMHAACRAPPPVIPRTRQRSCVTQAAKAASLSRRRRRGGGVMPSRQTSLPFLAGGSTHPLLTPINSGRCTCTTRSRNRHLTDALWNEQGHDLWEGGCKIRKMHRKKKRKQNRETQSRTIWRRAREALSCFTVSSTPPGAASLTSCSLKA